MNQIFIDDLAAPKLNAAQQAALNYARGLSIPLTIDSIMAEAQQSTGLSDWGDSAFTKRLQLLCTEWDTDEGLTNLGRMSLRAKLLQHACSRLKINERFAKHPEIRDVELAPPIIVAGLPRSGTTHLLNLMAADTRFRSLPLWESYEPVADEALYSSEPKGDPRYERCANAWQQMQVMTPHLAAMHPMDPDHIHEELELMGPNFGSYNYEWLSHSPRWRDHYYAEDQTYQYEYMRDVLKLLTWQDRQRGRGVKPWVLKCPQHLEQLGPLKHVFPDATLAITHRNPVDVIQSAVTMIAYGQRLNRRQVMMHEVLEYWVDRIEHLLRAAVNDRAIWPAAQSIDIAFPALIKDQLGYVERIYTLAGFTLDDAARDQLTTFLNHHSDDYGRVVYDLQGQFGVSREDLEKRFDFYFSAFSLEI